MERLDYNLLYRNSRNEDSSEYESECEESEYEESINDKQNLKYGKTIFNFFIDSCDRNWFTTIKQRECFDTEGKISIKEDNISGIELDTFDFKVKFGAASNSIETISLFNPVSKKKELVSQKFYEMESLAFNINIRNIESIKVQSVLLPKRFIYLGEASYCDILDYRYLLVCIEEISNTYYGTNPNINSAIAIVYPLSTVYPNNILKQVEFIDKGYVSKKFTPNPLNSIDNLRFTIKDPDGNVLNFKDDILHITNLEFPVEGDFKNKFIKITTKEFFNNEYKNGDIIKIKNLVHSNLLFQNFINRNTGHKIYISNENKFTELGEVLPDTIHLTIDNLHNNFHILVPGDYINNTFTPKEYLVAENIGTSISGENIGEILNTNLQLSILLKVETKTIEFDSLQTQII